MTQEERTLIEMYRSAGNKEVFTQIAKGVIQTLLDEMKYPTANVS